jgi:DNA-binding response OmpR family regulator
VDSDVALRRLLADLLHHYGQFIVAESSNGREALQRVKAGRYDLVLLEVRLPDIDGREVCRLMRRYRLKMPIVMLTAADSASDIILGLDAGANDYITKPFRSAVLLARLRAHVRQYEHSEDAEFAVGPYAFRPSDKLLIKGDGAQKVRLTAKETAILKFLYRSGENAVGRETLLDQVWGYNVGVTTHTLLTHICRLRRKIEPDPSEPTLLVTESGGYKLLREGGDPRRREIDGSIDRLQEPHFSQQQTATRVTSAPRTGPPVAAARRPRRAALADAAAR